MPGKETIQIGCACQAGRRGDRGGWRRGSRGEVREEPRRGLLRGAFHAQRRTGSTRSSRFVKASKISINLFCNLSRTISDEEIEPSGLVVISPPKSSLSTNNYRQGEIGVPTPSITQVGLSSLGYLGEGKNKGGARAPIARIAG